MRQMKDAYPQYDIGEFTYGKMTVDGSGVVKIGKYCSIASGLTLLMEGHNYKWFTTYPFPAVEMREDWPEAEKINGHPTRKSGVIIGNDVWIGKNVTIMSGVAVGDGAVIGAGSVVGRDVPPYAIVAGNPARVVKNRFNESTIKLLLSIRWWDWPVDEIKKHIKILCSSDIEALEKLVTDQLGPKHD